MDADSFKICPFCKEKIRKEAVKCRYCGEWLERCDTHPGVSESPVAQSAGENPPVEPERKKVTPSQPFQERFVNVLSPKASKRLGGILLTLCFLTLCAGLKNIQWGRLSPVQVESLTEAAIKSIFILLGCAWASSSIKRKGYRLFVFSILCSILTMIAVPSYLNGRHIAQARAAESDRQFVQDLTDIQNFLKNGAVGKIPQFSITGDPDNDAVSSVMNTFYNEYVPAYRQAVSSIQNLNEMDVFDNSLLTNRLSLKTEIRSRIASEQIIHSLSTNTISMLHDAENQYELQSASAEAKQDVHNSLDKATAQLGAIFDSLERRQNAEEKFLQFLDDNFNDFVITDSNIVFSTEGNGQKYSDLVKNIQDAAANVVGLTDQANSNVDQLKSRIH